MRCGASTSTRKDKNFSWYPPWVGVLILAGLLPYLIVALVLTKRMSVAAPMCSRHTGHWFWRTLIIILSLPALLIAIIGAVIVMSEADRAAGPGSNVAALICPLVAILFLGWLVLILVLQYTSIRPTEITDNSITLTGLSEEFVRAVEEERDRYVEVEEEDRPRTRRRSEPSDRIYDPRPRRPRAEPPDAYREDDRS
jgi:hypothetical protein